MKKKTNVLLICCDHLRADYLGANGNKIVMTPQMDQLAKQGTNFQNAFSQCPVCVPARRILMTGKNTYSLSINHNRDTQSFHEGPKLAEVMTQAGYQTFASGKLHVRPLRNRIGFEDVQLNEEGRKVENCKKDDYEMFLEDNGYAHLAYTHGLGNNEYGMRLSPVPEKYTSTHWTAQKAMEFIERRDPTRPFFLYVSFDKPHPPITPPQEYYDLYRDIEMPAPVMGNWEDKKCPNEIKAKRLIHNYEDWKDHPLYIQQSLKGYAAMVTHIDSMIGVILGTIQENGLLDDTLVILTGDHGDLLFDHGDMAKGNFFKGSTNVPFIIRPPKGYYNEDYSKRGIVNNELAVELMDIMPTILDICDIEKPKGMDGRSLAPILNNEKNIHRKYTCGNYLNIFGITDGRYKYIWSADDDIELMFDTLLDKDELDDISDTNIEKRNELRSYLIKYLEKNNDIHVAEGKLKAEEVVLDENKLSYSSIWNNRGRH